MGEKPGDPVTFHRDVENNRFLVRFVDGPAAHDVPIRNAEREIGRMGSDAAGRLLHLLSTEADRNLPARKMLSDTGVPVFLAPKWDGVQIDFVTGDDRSVSEDRSVVLNVGGRTTLQLYISAADQVEGVLILRASELLPGFGG